MENQTGRTSRETMDLLHNQLRTHYEVSTSYCHAKKHRNPLTNRWKREKGIEEDDEENPAYLNSATKASIFLEKLVQNHDLLREKVTKKGTFYVFKVDDYPTHRSPRKWKYSHLHVRMRPYTERIGEVAS